MFGKSEEIRFKKARVHKHREIVCGAIKLVPSEHVMSELERVYDFVSSMSFSFVCIYDVRCLCYILNEV